MRRLTSPRARISYVIGAFTPTFIAAIAAGLALNDLWDPELGSM